MKLNQLVEERNRTRLRAAKHFSYKVRETARIFLDDFDRGRRAKTKDIVSIYSENYNLTDDQFATIKDEELFIVKLHLQGWLREKNLTFSSMYDGDDENIRARLRKKEKIEDPHDMKEYKDLLLAVKGLIDHLRNTANLKFVQIGTEIVPVQKADLEDWITDLVNIQSNGVLIRPRAFNLYLKVPRKSK